jgi:hypothetical protein
VEQVTVYYSIAKSDAPYSPQNYPTPDSTWSTTRDTGSSGNNAWGNWVWSSQKTTIT